jgi:hypothetical protein
MERPTCNSCFFYCQEYHECRINPPDNDGFPISKPDQWCGSHPKMARYIDDLVIANSKKASHDNEATPSSGY